MKIPLVDRGNYYRGLLVLIRKDRAINVRESELMIRFGQALDFDKRFCEAAINDLMDNKHIRDEPMTFLTRATAECFLRDAIMLAFIDGDLHPKELAWLKAVADSNGLKDEWLQNEIRHLHEYQSPFDLPYPLSSGASSNSIEGRLSCESI
jgi:hypothetical protein